MLVAKPSKRDLERSAAHVLEREAAFTMNTTPGIVLPAQRVLDEFAHLRLDTTDLAPAPLVAETSENRLARQRGPAARAP